MTSTAPPLVVADIPDRQRAALAWRIRDLLFEADQRAVRLRGFEPVISGEIARIEYLRTEFLGLIAELEGSKPLNLAVSDPRPAPKRLCPNCGRELTEVLMSSPPRCPWCKRQLDPGLVL